MARNQGALVENNFIAGLITENTALNFPANAATDAVNCVFDETGRVSKRAGLDIEEVFTLPSPVSGDVSQAYTEFLWTDVAGLGTKSFLAVQKGGTLYFYDVSSVTDVGTNLLSSTVNIVSFLAVDTVLNPVEFRCQYSQGNGVLIVVNRACEPFYVSYNVDTEAISATQISINYRDFIGVQDNFSLDSRPSFADIAAMKADANGGLHFYNLLNQGWWQGGITGGSPNATSALGQWDAAAGVVAGLMPSNADAVQFFRASNTDPFDVANVDAFNQGNTPAPKGHFILKVGQADRYNALTTAGYTLTLSTSSDVLISYLTGTTIGDYTSIPNAFDNVTSGVYASDSASGSRSSPGTLTVTSSGYIGKTYSPGTTVGKAVVYNYFTFSITGTNFSGGGGTRTAKLYAKNGSAPSSLTDGTLLGTSTVSVGTTTITVSSSDTVTVWDHVWISFSLAVTYTINGSGGNTLTVTSRVFEVQFFKREVVAAAGLLAEDFTTDRPLCTAFFAGRAWYSGIQSEGVSNNIYFSKIIEKNDDYGKCYQQNDPTSELFSDLLPSDGGVIKIPELGRVVKMIDYQTVLFIFATNGVWLIAGDRNNGFKATEFNVRKISSYGTQSPDSFTTVDGLPIWWGEHDILQMEFNPQFETYSVKSLSNETIRRFFLDIPVINRNYVKAAYDAQESLVYWLYKLTSDPNNLANNVLFDYDACLVYNTISKAFMPWEFSTTGPDIRGISYVEDSIGVSEPKIKFTLTKAVTGSTDYLIFGEQERTTPTYSDWTNAATQTLGTANSYDAYFFSGYRLDGEAQRYVQSPYVVFYLENETNASCFVQSVFDFTNSGNSGKWSSKQQIYNDGLTNRDVHSRRLKMRGKGRAMQMKFTAEAGKPFTLLGWSMWLTQNASV